jgi:hypothetical protein
MRGLGGRLCHRELFSETAEGKEFDTSILGRGYFFETIFKEGIPFVSAVLEISERRAEWATSKLSSARKKGDSAYGSSLRIFYLY